MTKVLLLFLLTLSPLLAQSIEATYNVKFSFFGKIGESIVTYEREHNHYKITVRAITMGITATLTSNRVETYISEGNIVNGLLQPHTFISSKKSDKKIRTKTYTFDHHNQRITLDVDTTRFKTKRSFDIKHMKIIETKNTVVSHSNRLYDYYAKDDAISLFFNTPTYLKETPKAHSKQVHAIGINHDDDAITITLPSEQKERKIKKHLRVPASNHVYTIDVSKDVLTEDDAAGELIITMDNNNMPTAVFMENIALFGDIKAKKVSEKILP